MTARKPTQRERFKRWYRRVCAMYEFTRPYDAAWEAWQAATRAAQRRRK